MAAILVFFCLIANWPFWPRSRLNILLNFTFESEVKRANLQGNKRILKWRPFWNKVYSESKNETVGSRRTQTRKMNTNEQDTYITICKILNTA